MNVVETIAIAARQTGYRKEAIRRDYAFADVLEKSATTRRVALAAFTQTPPSYRSAALGVIVGNGARSLDQINSYRALGAPLMLSVDDNDVSLWQVRSSAPPRMLERLTASEIPALFERNKKEWQPEAIHRAKSIGAIEREYQLDFVDAGLMPIIEGELQVKLDRLLKEALNAAKAERGSQSLNAYVLFRAVFRLVAAKVLADRAHPHASTWDQDNLRSVLQGIESYYTLPSLLPLGKDVERSLAAAWQRLRLGISFSNISADDLSFVYENTLVTPETRKIFGTHSTPWQVAEYIVQRLELHRHNPNDLLIYEPFAGAATFLVSALRHLRDLLSVDWSDQRRHNFLIKHLESDEIEPFACEVARLSLILADYPNHNDWRINEIDLFKRGVLQSRTREHNMILCNPPFEDFSDEERNRYSIESGIYSKTIFALDAALNANPLALGFVLPRPFLVEAKFLEQRRRIERQYKDIELVELPDRIFNASTVEAALLIARGRRPESSSDFTAIRSTEVRDRDRLSFLKSGSISNSRSLVRKADVNGVLWIPPLFDVWTYLRDYPRLRMLFDAHLGARWKYDQKDAVSDKPKPGFRRGLFSAEDIRQFAVVRERFVDLNPSHLTHAIGREWDATKIITNGVRLSRGPWRLAAVTDRSGLAFSQQFVGLWLKKNQGASLESFEAVLNGPIANAYLASRFSAYRFRLESMLDLPIPVVFPPELDGLVKEYRSLVTRDEFFDEVDVGADVLLTRIDALVLQAYDLPTKLERQLLQYFGGAQRPVNHDWVGWDEQYAAPGLRLSERISGRFPSTTDWVTDVFSALPEDEAANLRDYGE